MALKVWQMLLEQRLYVIKGRLRESSFSADEIRRHVVTLVPPSCSAANSYGIQYPTISESELKKIFLNICSSQSYSLSLKKIKYIVRF